ncbi:MAG: hypothetical protein HC817_07495, partial [Saprospiraceae bacterium]|nr:hypothetical protein [Saprospiraceae bacterium]
MSPTEKGLFIIYENIKDKIQKLKLVLGEENKHDEYFNTLPKNEISLLIQSQNPNLVLYNSLLPFLVSLIEYLLSNTFEIMLKYDVLAYDELSKENLKIPIEDVMKISNGELTLTQIITKNYNFQNLEVSNKVYKKHLKIDLFKTISIKKKVNKKVIFLKDELSSIISRRHLMIHEFAFDYDYNKEKFMFSLNVVELFLEVFISEIEKYSTTA